VQVFTNFEAKALDANYPIVLELKGRLRSGFFASFFSILLSHFFIDQCILKFYIYIYIYIYYFAGRIYLLAYQAKSSHDKGKDGKKDKKEKEKKDDKKEKEREKEREKEYARI
jgi:hypothetical protein